MATNAVTTLIVPQGQVVDFIDNSFRKDTPEEYVRQEIEKAIVREYEYPREEISVEFPIKVGTSRRRVDLAIFPEGEPHKQETVWSILECKAASVPPNHRSEGVEQLKSYLAACLNAEFGMWTNGQDRFCFRKVREGDRSEFVEITDLPVQGPGVLSICPAGEVGPGGMGWDGAGANPTSRDIAPARLPRGDRLTVIT